MKLTPFIFPRCLIGKVVEEEERSTYFAIKNNTTSKITYQIDQGC